MNLQETIGLVSTREPYSSIETPLLAEFIQDVLREILQSDIVIGPGLTGYIKVTNGHEWQGPPIKQLEPGRYLISEVIDADDAPSA